MYRIPGIVSCIQQKKENLNSEDVIQIGTQLWNNRENPAFIRCIRGDPESYENYLDNPYDPNLSVQQREEYEIHPDAAIERSAYADQDDDDEAVFFDLEKGLDDKERERVMAEKQQRMKRKSMTEEQKKYADMDEICFWKEFATSLNPFTKVTLSTSDKSINCNGKQESRPQRTRVRTRTRIPRTRRFAMLD